MGEFYQRRSGDLGEKWPLNLEVVLRIFIALKNPSTSAGIEPATLGAVASTLTTSPPRQIYGIKCTINCSKSYLYITYCTEAV
jgi:hypothetical protein